MKNLNVDVNIDKTKVTIIIEDKSEQTKEILCKWKNLQIVTTFEYLGLIITNDSKVDEELEIMKLGQLLKKLRINSSIGLDTHGECIRIK